MCVLIIRNAKQYSTISKEGRGSYHIYYVGGERKGEGGEGKELCIFSTFVAEGEYRLPQPITSCCCFLLSAYYAEGEWWWLCWRGSFSVGLLKRRYARYPMFYLTLD